MASPIRSIDDLLAQENAQGALHRIVALATPNTSTTSANNTSGYNGCRRFPQSFTVPSMGGSILAAYMTYFRCGFSSGIRTVLAAIDVDMGTLTVSGNSFADGAAMPSRQIPGGSGAVQLATVLPVLHVATALTATTPVVTITYKNQAGTGSRTATMTLPTSPALDSCFFITPHLQAGDTGIQDVTNISISTGSAGVLKVRGLLVVGVESSQGTTALQYPMLTNPTVMWPIQAGDVIGFYSTFAITAFATLTAFSLVGET